MADRPPLHPIEAISPAEDRTFALHALLAYGTSLLLILFLGSRLQNYSLNYGLLLTEAVFIALPAAVVLWTHRKTAGERLFSPPRPRQMALAVVIGASATAIAVYKGIAARETLAGVDSSGVDVTGGMSLLLLVVVAPCCEELLFRPVLQNGLARHWSNRTAVLVTAMLFALFHLQLLRFAETFVIGLFSGIVFLKTRNVWYSVLVHAICNGLGPMLWRWAPHLDVLFNPAAIIGLGCLALTGCYSLGPRSPTPLKGLWQRLRWAAFGTLPSHQTTQRRSRLATPLTWTMVLSLMVLLGYSHAVLVRHLEGGRSKSNNLVSQDDAWTIVSADEVRVRSELVIRKFPEVYEDLVLRFPFPEAAVEKVTLENEDLPFSTTGKGECRVDLSSRNGATAPGSLIVLWSFSMASLAPDMKWGYRVPLQSLVPSGSLTLTVTLGEESGLRFLGGNGDRTRPLFRGTPKTPTVNYGSCGMAVERDAGPPEASRPQD